MLDAHRWDAALGALGSALAEYPDSFAGWCLSAMAYSGLGRPGESLAAATRAITLGPDQEWGHRLASLAYGQLGRHREAVAAARRARGLAPNAWQSHTRLAMALAAARRGRTEARAAAERAVILAPGEPETHFAVGFVALRFFRSREAEAAFRRVLALVPDHAAALNNLAKIRLGRGRVLAAALGFGAALVADPNLGVARSNVDVVARRLLVYLNLGLLGLFALVSGLTHPPQEGGPEVGAPTVAAVAAAGVVAVVVAAIWLDRSLPSPMRSYFRRLPVSDWRIGACLGVDVAVMAVVVALPFASRSGRVTLKALGAGLLVGLLYAVGVVRVIRRLSRAGKGLLGKGRTR